MTPELIKKYSQPVPRYTSYPTAPHFSEDIGASTYKGWLEALDDDLSLSLYVHIPFCEQMCWYCGCNTKATQKYAPVSDYLRSLIQEISHVTRHTKPSQIVRDIHWGGGSPNILSAADILRLSDAIRGYFNLSDDVIFAVEVDPRSHTPQQTDAFALAGVTRLSVGVQDFNQDVQAAINRIQSYDATRRVIEDFRDRGIASVNIDLVYGLPMQTTESAERTITQVLELAPDRIALFGYAHLPKRIPHQRLINSRDLPDAIERFAQQNRLAQRLTDAGYVRIGLDHFAKPTDPLAQRNARRNFQGYTDDQCDGLIGLGASAIGQLPQGYVQNVVPTGEYRRQVAEGRLPVVRGHAMTDEDRLRAFVIEELMCNLEFSADRVADRFGGLADAVVNAARQLVDSDSDGLLERAGSGFRVTSRGRPFVRSIAACFDAYLGSENKLYSVGV